jgi:uncharacterized protein YqgC (DUF456 family)
MVVLAMLACLALIPFGLPGLWLMVVIVMGLVLAGSLSWTFGLIAAAVVAGAEFGEFVVLSRFGKQFGGSKRAFLGAIVGGMAGLFVGVPVPLIGPIITAFIGTFLGAGLVTLYETRSLEQSTRVGFGLVLARTVAVALKVATAVLLTASVAVALLF